MKRFVLVLVAVLGWSSVAGAQAPPPQPLTVVTLPAGVRTFPDNVVPGDTIYETAGPATVIRAQNPDTEFVLIGPRAIFRGGVSIHDKFGTQPIVMRYQPNGPRYIAHLQNSHEGLMISTHWVDTASYISGGVAGVDSPVTAVRCVGAWSACLYTESHEQTYGVHTGAFADSKGVLVQHFDRATGIWIIAEAGATPPFGSLTFTPNADVRSVHIQPNVPTTADIQMVSTVKTSGSWLALFHSTSVFSGSLFHANMAFGSGVFNGNIFDIVNAGRNVFRVTSDGDLVTGRLAERVAALEALVQQLLQAQQR